MNTLFHRKITLTLPIMLALMLVTLVLSLSSVSVVYAATIAVNTTDDEINSDGDCSLREAIQAANSDSAVDACTPGSGADIITLPAGVYTISADQSIFDDLTINGAGASSTIIDRAGAGATSTMRAFYVNNGRTLALNNLTVQHGHAHSNDYGGGIYINDGTLNVTNGVIADNHAGVGSTTTSGRGGGIYNDNGTVTITNSTISGNYAGICGGGIANENDGTLNVTNSTFSDNESSWGGGINLSANTPIAIIASSTFTGNNGINTGGGINVFAGEITITNSTFSANTGHLGAALSNNDTMSVINSTIISNTTDTGSGSVRRYGGTLTLVNSIVSADLGAANCSGTITDGGNNLEDADDCSFSAATSLTNTNPMLAPLADNGGPTLTHAPQPGSPAIDAGDNSTCAAAPVNNLDQRGMTRPVDGDADSTDTCDIGAYEAGEKQCSVAIDTTYTFTTQSNVAIRVTDLGTSNLSCLFVDEKSTNHPQATGTSGGSGIMTGKYWTINGLQSDGSTIAATGYTLTLTLTHSITPHANAFVCKYPGTQGGYGWDCFRTSSTTSTVRLDEITSLSDWAVGNHVGPTAVSLQTLQVNISSVPVGLLPAALGGLAVLGLVGLFMQRRQAR